MIVFCAFAALVVGFENPWGVILYYSRFVLGGLLIVALGALLESMTKDK